MRIHLTLRTATIDITSDVSIAYVVMGRSSTCICADVHRHITSHMGRFTIATAIDITTDVDALVLTNRTDIHRNVAIHVGCITTAIDTGSNCSISIRCRLEIVGTIDDSDTYLFCILTCGRYFAYCCRTDINGNIAFHWSSITTAKDLTYLADVHTFTIGLHFSVNNTLHGVDPDVGVTNHIGSSTKAATKDLTDRST